MASVYRFLWYLSSSITMIKISIRTYVNISIFEQNLIDSVGEETEQMDMKRNIGREADLRKKTFAC